MNPFKFEIKTQPNYKKDMLDCIVIYRDDLIKSNKECDVLHVSSYIKDVSLQPDIYFSYALRYIDQSYSFVDRKQIGSDIVCLDFSRNIFIKDYVNQYTKYMPRSKDFKLSPDAQLYKNKRGEFSMSNIFNIKKNIHKFLELKLDSKNKSLRLLYDSKYNNFMIVDSVYDDIRRMVFNFNINKLGVDEFIKVLDYKNIEHSISITDYTNFLKQEVLIPDYYIYQSSFNDLFLTMLCFEEFHELKNFIMNLHKRGKVV